MSYHSIKSQGTLTSVALKGTWMCIRRGVDSPIDFQSKLYNKEPEYNLRPVCVRLQVPILLDFVEL